MISFNPDALDWFPLGGLSIPQSGYPQLSSVHNIDDSGVTTLRVDKITNENVRTQSAEKIQDKQSYDQYNNEKGIHPLNHIGEQHGNTYPPSQFERMKVTRELPVLMPDIRNGLLQNYYYNNSQFPRSILYNHGYKAPNLMFPNITHGALPFFPIHSMGFTSQTLQNHLVARMHAKNIFRHVLQMPINPLGVLNPTLPNQHTAISTHDQRYATLQRPSLTSASVSRSNDATLQDPGRLENESAINQCLLKQVRTSGKQYNNPVRQNKTNNSSKHSVNTHIPVNNTNTTHSTRKSTTMNYGNSSSYDVTTSETSKIDFNNKMCNHNTTTKIANINHKTTAQQHLNEDHSKPTENRNKRTKLLVSSTSQVPIASKAITNDKQQTHFSSKNKVSFLDKKIVLKSSYNKNGEIKKTISSNDVLDNRDPLGEESPTNCNNLEFYMNLKSSPDKVDVTKNNVGSSSNEIDMPIKPSRNRYTEFLNEHLPLNHSAAGKIIHSDDSFLYILFESKTSPPTVKVRLIPIDRYRKATSSKARSTNKDPATKINSKTANDRIVESVIVDDEPSRSVDNIRKENCGINKRDETIEKVIVSRGEKNTDTIYDITSDSGDCMNTQNIQDNGFRETNDKQNTRGNTCHTTLSTDSSQIPSVIGISSLSSSSSSFTTTSPSLTTSTIVSSTSFSSSSANPSLLYPISYSLPAHLQPSSIKDDSTATQPQSFKSKNCKNHAMPSVTSPNDDLHDIATQLFKNDTSIENGYTAYAAVKASPDQSKEIASKPDKPDNVDTGESLKNIFLRKSLTSGDWEPFIRSEKIEREEKRSEIDDNNHSKDNLNGILYCEGIKENAKGGHSLRKRKLNVVENTQITRKRVTYEEDTPSVIMENFPKTRSISSRNLRNTHIRILKGSLDEDVNVSTLNLKPRVILHDIIYTYPEFSNHNYED